MRDRPEPDARTPRPRPMAARAPAETLAERAYRLIEDDIVRLELAPGLRLTEQDLVSRVGLGRTPVREAVQRLVWQGLLHVFPRRGIVVAALNPVEVLLALEARLPLEELVAGTAALRRSDEDQARLAALVGAMEEAAAEGEAERYMQLDRALDEHLGKMAGNPYAARALEPLRTMSRRAWFSFCRDADLAEAARAHRPVVEAIGARDEGAARAAAAALVGHVRSGIKTALAGL